MPLTFHFIYSWDLQVPKADSGAKSDESPKQASIYRVRLKPLEQLVLCTRPLLLHGSDGWSESGGMPGSLTTDPWSSWRPLGIRNGIKWPSALHKLTANHPFIYLQCVLHLSLTNGSDFKHTSKIVMLSWPDIMQCCLSIVWKYVAFMLIGTKI